MTDDIFRVEWDTGYIEALVSSFFVDSKVVEVKKLFKLARRYCSETQRGELMQALTNAVKERQDLLDSLGELSYEKSVLANSFFHMACEPEMGWAEKRALREQVQFKRAIDLLKKERWNE